MCPWHRESAFGGGCALVERVSCWLGCWRSSEPFRPPAGDGLDQPPQENLKPVRPPAWVKSLLAGPCLDREAKHCEVHACVDLQIRPNDRLLLEDFPLATRLCASRCRNHGLPPAHGLPSAPPETSSPEANAVGRDWSWSSLRNPAHPMARCRSCKGCCQGMPLAPLRARFACRPNPRHEVGFCGDSFEPCCRQACVDVVTDVIAVVRLMEDAPEVLHHSGELA